MGTKLIDIDKLLEATSDLTSEKNNNKVKKSRLINYLKIHVIGNSYTVKTFKLLFMTECLLLI